ncbi:peptide chain release factor N(5)-glutamine methyltransferase [Deinococcus sp. MIMF12]|uniref:Release factor glutamine methyltransferase n=1 Tax=Deinococcus rhizophilus TaxID=3049544 RepID=A0ABT7JD42_9DEIO|nr:peptide chain release factor N(5)-glutamine methyltransferase [Deinococcus rhizophilus]MDL2342952.1 peptide chain release factor N(5)-glutamine methyltransferase [Deinococcus rhizophilus]
MPTLHTLLTGARERLREAGVPSPEADARALVTHALGLTGAALLTRAGEAVPDEGAARLRALLERRIARVPLQHLLGEVEWGGVRLRTDGRALVPRPETEWLLHLALEALRPLAAPRVLDVGTGTGALALGLKAARPDAHVTATDLSPQALTLARENAVLNGLDVAFVEGSLLAGLPGPFDLIVSNPPYLPDGDRAGADPEVRFDPDLALYAGPDGLDVARPLAAEAQAALTAGGALLLELDPRNAPTLAGELRAAGWEAEVLPDLAGRERFVRATPPPPGIRPARESGAAG